MWNKLFFPNADVAIDLHTQTRGTAYPMFVFADYRDPSVKEMASYLNADQVKDDEGVLGTAVAVHTITCSLWGLTTCFRWADSLLIDTCQ